MADTEMIQKAVSAAMNGLRPFFIRLLESQQELATELDRHGNAERTQHQIVQRQSQLIEEQGRILQAQQQQLKDLQGFIEKQAITNEAYAKRLALEDAEISRLRAERQVGSNKILNLLSNENVSKLIVALVAAAATYMGMLMGGK